MPVSVRFVQGLIEALECIGVPRERFLRAASLDPSSVRDVEGRLDSEAFDAALEAAVALSGDEGFGLHVGDMLYAVQYDLAFHIAAHAPTLDVAIDSLQRFYPLLSERPFLDLVEEGRTASLVYDLGAGPPSARRFRAEFTILALYRLLKHFAPKARPLVVAFDYPAPRYWSEYARCFEGTERFGTTFTGIVFDRALLVRSEVQHDRDLYALLVSHAERRLSEMEVDSGYAERVRRHVLAHPSLVGNDMAAIARSFGVSARTLRRRLAEEGTGFREVVNRALGSLARRRMLDEDRTIESVARAMGFSQRSAFHRAFKRWTGATPAAARAGLRPIDPKARRERRERRD
jgi:AraC-like DNA-binding protein